MKILAINGSHRGDKGYTGFLINKIFEGAKSENAVCETVTLTRADINRCTACDTCHTEKSYLKCIFDEKDDVKKIFSKIADADVIIYATPIYIFGMSGLLKTFLDRMNSITDSGRPMITEQGLLFYQFIGKVCSKPFVTLLSCDNFENETHKNVLDYFKTFSKFMDAPQCGVLIRNLAKLSGSGKSKEILEKLPKLTQVYDAYIQAGKELAIKGSISKATEKIANQEIVPIPGFSFRKKFTDKTVLLQHITNLMKVDVVEKEEIESVAEPKISKA